MLKLSKFLTAVLLIALGGCAHHVPAPEADIGFIRVDADITLRRLIVRNPEARGTVLFLHGFPETLYTWKEIALALGKDYEVHAFDWPGYGRSSRPAPERFGYAPADYARVLKAYIEKSDIDKSKLVTYATDIGALPALLLALEEPDIAKKLVVGDFAPFDRPQYMRDNLQALKSKASAESVRAALNKNRDEILENAFRRGLPKEEQFELPQEFKDDMLQGWNHGGMTTADAFHHYYSHFTRDQNYFEANLQRLKTSVKVVWGERDFYIKPEMGAELANRARLQIEVLPSIGHYPHLQSPKHVVEEVRTAFSYFGIADTFVQSNFHD